MAFFSARFPIVPLPWNLRNKAKEYELVLNYETKELFVTKPDSDNAVGDDRFVSIADAIAQIIIDTGFSANSLTITIDDTEYTLKDILTQINNTVEEIPDFQLNADNDEGKILIIDKDDTTGELFIKSVSMSELSTLLDLANPDWNQNDSTASDYIKNRICYTETNAELANIQNQTFTSNMGMLMYSDDNTINMIVGSEVTVTFNGTDYVRTVESLNGLAAVGNSSLPQNGDGDDFFVVNANILTSGSGGTYIVRNSIENPISIKIVGDTIKQLDEKYVPDSCKIGKSGTGTLSELFNSAAEASGSYSHAEGDGTTASGSSSHAEGDGTTASGSSSHAEGSSTTASGDYSHAEGYSTTASGNYSHAEGNNTTASGAYSHAEGLFTTASGEYSHAEGDSKASGFASHAEGYATEASGNYSHAEGEHTLASSYHQHVQGKYNIEDTTNTYLHIVGNGTSDTYRSNAHTLDINGNAWFAGKVTAEGTPTDDNDLTTKAYVDSKTVATMTGATATTIGAAGLVPVPAIGDESKVLSGAGTWVEMASGDNTQPDWNQSDSTASDYIKNRICYTETNAELANIQNQTFETDESYSNSLIYIDNNATDFVAGTEVTVTINGSSYIRTVNTDYDTNYIGNIELADDTAADGDDFLIYNLNIIDWTSVATSYLVRNVENPISISIVGSKITQLDEKYIPDFCKIGKHGTGTLSELFNSAIEASGHYSHAEGRDTIASGDCSHTEGYDTTASGTTSHAEGYSTTASGNYSHSEGWGTTASSKFQHVQGTYNIEDTTNTYLHIVGNGTTDTYRSNAHTLDINGNAWFAGNVECSGIIIRSSTANSTKKFKITVNDSGTISATEVTS